MQTLEKEVVNSTSRGKRSEFNSEKRKNGVAKKLLKGFFCVILIGITFGLFLLSSVGVPSAFARTEVRT